MHVLVHHVELVDVVILKYEHYDAWGGYRGHVVYPDLGELYAFGVEFGPALH